MLFAKFRRNILSRPEWVCCTLRSKAVVANTQICIYQTAQYALTRTLFTAKKYDFKESFDLQFL